jgi:hypothetical protein
VALWILKVVNDREALLDLEKTLDTISLDEYATVRGAYLQNRRFLVYDGNPPEDHNLYPYEAFLDDDEILEKKFEDDDELLEDGYPEDESLDGSDAAVEAEEDQNTEPGPENNSLPQPDQ